MSEKSAGFLHVTKRLLLIVGSVIVIAVVVVIILARGGDEDLYEFVVAERGDLIQEVSVTGRVRALENVELAFEKTGTIAQVLVDVGDTVSAGKTLVTLRNSDIVALLNQAEAQVDVERAELSELTGNADAQQDLTNSYNDILNTVNDALAKSEDAVRSKTAGLFSGSETAGYNLTFGTCEGATSKSATTLRLKAELELDKWNRELDTLGVSAPRSVLDKTLSDAQEHLGVIEDFVDATNMALLTKCATDNSSLDTGRTNMATAQTNVLTVIDNINNLQQAIASQSVTAENSDEVRAKEAKVRAAEASAQNYASQLTQTIINSPIDGIVTRQDAKVGETISANTAIVSVISISDFEIEANIPEADVAKVKIGDTSTVTLDAYGNDVLFEARVTKIDPGETVIEGVTTYKTTLQFTAEDDRIKSGMTANLDILTARLTGVITIPQRAVISRQGEKLVRILTENDELKEITVETGLRSSDGSIEITRGVQEGDRIVTFIKEE